MKSLNQHTRLGGGSGGLCLQRRSGPSCLAAAPRSLQRGPCLAPRAAAAVDQPSTSAAPGRGPGEQQQQQRFTQEEWDSFVSGWSSQHQEHAFFVDEGQVDGAIPAELSGTLLRNGPALYEIGGKSIPQPFDGDGMVAQFCFPGSGRPPFFANRFVRTQAFVEEQEAGRMLYRGAFSVGNASGGWLFNPFDLSIKKVANTGVVRWAKRTLALHERDLPYELSGPDLRTVGRTDCGGAIDRPYCAAHYRVFAEDDGTRRLVAFSSAEKGLANEVQVWEFDEDMNRLHSTSVALPDAAFAFLHDFAVTERHYIFVENPVRLDLFRMATEYMLGKACIAECLAYDTKRQTKVHVIPRPRKGAAPQAAPRAYPAPSPFFSFHHSNAFEAADGRVVVDTVALHDGMSFSANLSSGAAYYDDDVGRGTLTRVVIDPSTGEVEAHRLMQRACEFPCVAPAAVGRAHTHTYLVGARMDEAESWGAPQVVVKVSASTAAGVSSALGPADVQQRVYAPGPQRWAQEPIFVARPGSTSEDDGWVLSLVYDAAAARSELVILDARSMEVAATVKLPFMLPSGLHGSFSSEYLGPEPGSDYPARQYDIRSGAGRYE